jgi:hypothetical protein
LLTVKNFLLSGPLYISLNINCLPVYIFPFLLLTVNISSCLAHLYTTLPVNFLPVYISSCQLLTCVHLFLSGLPVYISSSCYTPITLPANCSPCIHLLLSITYLYTSLPVHCLPVYISSCLAHLYTSLPAHCLPVYITSLLTYISSCQLFTSIHLFLSVVHLPTSLPVCCPSPYISSCLLSISLYISSWPLLTCTPLPVSCHLGTVHRLSVHSSCLL